MILATSTSILLTLIARSCYCWHVASIQEPFSTCLYLTPEAGPVLLVEWLLLDVVVPALGLWSAWRCNMQAVLLYFLLTMLDVILWALGCGIYPNSFSALWHTYDDFFDLQLPLQICLVTDLVRFAVNMLGCHFSMRLRRELLMRPAALLPAQPLRGAEVAGTDAVQRLCLACCTNRANTMCKPCRHSSLCENCLVRSFQTYPKQVACPVCRIQVVAYDVTAKEHNFLATYIDEETPEETS